MSQSHRQGLCQSADKQEACQSHRQGLCHIAMQHLCCTAPGAGRAREPDEKFRRYREQIFYFFDYAANKCYNYGVTNARGVYV